MEEFSFEKLNAWKYARALVREVYGIIRKLPVEERFGLCDQMRRAIVSVPSNLAEGSGRISKAEQRHFYEIAYGSLMEVYCQLMLAVDLGYIQTGEITDIRHHIHTTAKLITALRASVKE